MKAVSVRPSTGRIVAGFAVLLALTGCQTTSTTATPPPEPEPRTVSIAPFEFVPQDYFAPLRTGPVRYRMLYAPESHAIWVTDEVNALKRTSDESRGIEIGEHLTRTAEVAEARFIVIECRLESAFADSSVAYDVVGMRNVDVYLETPSGERVHPVQRIMAPRADEEAEEALIRFGRTSVLVFPKADPLTGSASPISGASSVRLVLEGFHSTFYFEWKNAGQAELVEVSDIGSAGRAASARDAIRTGYTSIYSLLSPLQRIVD